MCKPLLETRTDSPGAPTKPHKTLKVASTHFLDGLWTVSFHTPRLAYQNPPSIHRVLLTIRER